MMRRLRPPAGGLGARDCQRVLVLPVAMAVPAAAETTCGAPGLLLFEVAPRRVLGTWEMLAFTAHPRGNLFEADEFAAELARHGLNGTGAIERPPPAQMPHARTC